MLSIQGLEWTPFELFTEKWAASSGIRDGDSANIQHNLGTLTGTEAREEEDMQIELDALSHEMRDRDPADAQLDCTAEKEGAARQEDDMQIEGDAPYNDPLKEVNGSIESNHQESDRLAAEVDTLINDFSMAFNSIESNQQETGRLAAENTALIHQLKEVQYQYSLLARLDLTRTPTILARPAEDMEAIVTRALRFTQSTSDVEAARILDSMNCDLPIGTQLIADVSVNVFILICTPRVVHIFDKADIVCIQYDSWFRVRLIMKGWCLELCSALNAQGSWLCEQWGKRYAEGVDATYVRG